jgi:DNA-binding transcriptional ArsR family regulator
MRHLVRTTKALADDNRIRILGALKGRELCVCQLIELLGLAPSTVSKHLSILRNARLIESRKAGRWIYYRMAGDDAPRQITAALNWVLQTFAESRQHEADNLKLDAILQMDPELLCGRQT